MRLFYEFVVVPINQCFPKQKSTGFTFLFCFYSFLLAKFPKPLQLHDSVYMYAYVHFCLCTQAEAARDSKQSPMVQRNSSFATSHEVWKYINELGISKVDPEGHDLLQRRLVFLVGVLAPHVPSVCPTGRWTFPWTTSRPSSTRSSTTARWR